MTDIAIKLKVHPKTLFNRIRGWAQPGSGFSYNTWAKELRTEMLIDYCSQGMHASEIAKQFRKYDLPNKRQIAEHVDEILKIDVDALETISYSESVISQWTKEYLGVSAGTAYEKYYIKPIILILARLGLSQAQVLDVLEAMEVVSRMGVPYTADSLTDMLKNRLWGPNEGLPWGGSGSKDSLRDVMMEPIIENLIRYTDSSGKHLSAAKIAGLFGRTDSFIKTYIRRVWGFNTLTEARNFFESNYLGYHRYDFFMFS